MTISPCIISPQDKSRGEYTKISLKHKYWGNYTNIKANTHLSRWIHEYWGLFAPSLIWICLNICHQILRQIKQISTFSNFQRPQIICQCLPQGRGERKGSKLWSHLWVNKPVYWTKQKAKELKLKPKNLLQNFSWIKQNISKSEVNLVKSVLWIVPYEQSE